MINLADGTNSISELQDLAEWIKTDPRLTIGDFTTEFEKKWSKKLSSNSCRARDANRYAAYFMA